MSKLLKASDATGVSPNTLLSLEGQTTHKTVIGGLFSIIAYMIIFIIAIVLLFPLIGTPPFTQTYSFSTLQSINNTLTYNIQAQQSVLTSRIVGLNLFGNFNITKYVVPVYTSEVIDVIALDKSTVTKRQFRAVPCLEKFAGQSQNMLD
jgi:hypothetical protein